jgi:carboxylesterase type B
MNDRAALACTWQAVSSDGSTGNFGQQDQRLAMEWVKQHVSHFGGDPAKIMVFGQSSGAASIAMHLVRGGEGKRAAVIGYRL